MLSSRKPFYIHLRIVDHAPDETATPGRGAKLSSMAAHAGGERFAPRTRRSTKPVPEAQTM
jgi:hypothetical protein